MFRMTVGSTNKRILWGVGTPRTMRAHWALHELSLAYETMPIGSRTGETQTAAFSALNPRQKIPVLQDGDFTIAESPAIISYLAEAYCVASTSLLPANSNARARCQEWSFFITAELDATLYVIRRHTGLSEIYGEAPVAVDAAKGYFVRQLRHVDQVLCSGGPFLMDDRFTTADILLATCLTWAIMRDVPIHDGCHAYLDRVTAREAYRTAAKANLARQKK
jgi:glutathione S-transferase